MSRKAREDAECGIADELIGQLEGAMVVDGHIADGAWLHLSFADGRVLVISGYSSISVFCPGVLH